MGDLPDGRSLVLVDRSGPVTTVTLDSPGNRNALSSSLLAQLLAALRDAQADPEVRVVVLTGSGSTFCSGVDLDERLHPSPVAEPPDPDTEPPPTLPEVLTCLVGLPQPVVALVNGHVRAGGMGLVAAADLAVAGPTATFAFTEVRVGVAPAVIAVPALRVMDRRAFARYALTGETFGADDAAAAGLLTAVDDRPGEWVDRAVGAFLRASPPAVAATKGLLADHGWDDALASAEALSDELFASDDGAEGMAAFLDRRPPRWVVDRPSPGGPPPPSGDQPPPSGDQPPPAPG